MDPTKDVFFARDVPHHEGNGFRIAVVIEDLGESAELGFKVSLAESNVHRTLRPSNRAFVTRLLPFPI